MTKSFLSKASTLTLIILLALNLLVTFISSNPEAKAKENLQYRVVDAGYDYRTSGGFQELCNQMAKEGWRYIDTNSVDNLYRYTFEK